MEPLAEAQLRRCLVNATKGEAGSLTLPAGFRELDWSRLAYLGWRDPKAPLRGAIAYWRDERPIGLLLRAAESSMSSRRTAMCLLCHTAQPAHLISLFVARRAGARGRDGNTVGTYMCADLDCASAVRDAVRPTRERPDPEPEIARRMAGLRSRLDSFVDAVLEAPAGAGAGDIH